MNATTLTPASLRSVREASAVSRRRVVEVVNDATGSAISVQDLCHYEAGRRRIANAELLWPALVALKSGRTHDEAIAAVRRVRDGSDDTCVDTSAAPVCGARCAQ